MSAPPAGRMKKASRRLARASAYFAKLSLSEPGAFYGKVGGSLVLWRIFGVFGVVYSFFLA